MPKKNITSKRKDGRPKKSKAQEEVESLFHAVAAHGKGGKVIELKPRPDRTYEYMRKSGHDTLSAIGDQIDNTIDAGANAIHVNIDNIGYGDEIRQIRVSDNGCGMTSSQIIDAVTMGSKNRKSSDKLGKFGVGMNASSLSISKRLMVFSKTSSSKVSKAVIDYDEIQEHNKDVAVVDSSESSSEFFYRSNEAIKGRSGALHGSLLVMDKIDKCEFVTIETLAKNLHEYIGRVFCRFIGKKVKIYINGERVKKNDPIRKNVEKVLINKIISVHGGQYLLKLVELKDMGKKIGMIGNKAAGHTPSKCGFYFYRNGRELIAAKNLSGIIPHHSTALLLRCEIAFTGTVDETFDPMFTKTRVKLPHYIRETIKKTVSKLVAIHIKNHSGPRTDDERFQPSHYKLNKFKKPKKYGKKAMESIYKKLASNASRNAKQKGFSCKLDWKDIRDMNMPMIDPYNGQKLTSEKSRMNTVTLDRIDSKRGYIKGNVELCGLQNNLSKRDMSKEAYIALIKSNYKYLSKKKR